MPAGTTAGRACVSAGVVAANPAGSEPRGVDRRASGVRVYRPAAHRPEPWRRQNGARGSPNQAVHELVQGSLPGLVDARNGIDPFMRGLWTHDPLPEHDPNEFEVLWAGSSQLATAKSVGIETQSPNHGPNTGIRFDLLERLPAFLWRQDRREGRTLRSVCPPSGSRTTSASSSIVQLASISRHCRSHRADGACSRRPNQSSRSTRHAPRSSGCFGASHRHAMQMQVAQVGPCVPVRRHACTHTLRSRRSQ